MLRIERVRADAFERVRAVRLRALRDAPDAYWTTVDEEETRPPAQWRDRLASMDAATFLASRNGSDVGLARGAPHYERDGDAELTSMWVAPEARGSGAAEALVRAVVEWARAAGYRSVRLEVGDTNDRAVRLYARMGFVPTGVVGTFRPPRDYITEHERALEL